MEDVKAVGHRIVHGGALDASTLLTAETRAEVERAAVFAPLHNPAHLTGVDGCEAFFPGRPQVQPRQRVIRAHSRRSVRVCMAVKTQALTCAGGCV